MVWESVRFKELNKGDVFKKGEEVYLFEGEQDKKGRTNWFYGLEPVERDPYCEDDRECEHFMINEIPYHRGFGFQDEDGEHWEPHYLIRKRDTAQMDMRVERYIAPAQSEVI